MPQIGVWYGEYLAAVGKVTDLVSDFFVTALHNIIKHNLIDDGEGNSKAVGDFYTIASPETAHILRIHILHVSYCGQTYLLGGCTSAITSDETNGAVHQNRIPRFSR